MHMSFWGAKLQLVFATLAIAGCASIYVQPPLAGNALVRYSLESTLELTGAQYWLSGRDCSDRMRLSAEDVQAFSSRGVVLTAGKEFAVTFQAVRKAGIQGGNYYTETCDAGASFVPQAEGRYRIALTADYNHCKVQVFRQMGSPSSEREELDATFRVRKAQRHTCVSD